MLLQLRTHAASKRPKARALACLFITLDILAIIGLIAVGVLNFKTRLLLPDYFNGNFGGPAYDPYLWIVLVPIEACTLIANLRLAWITFRYRQEERTTVPRLLVVILRDNICYLGA